MTFIEEDAMKKQKLSPIGMILSIVFIAILVVFTLYPVLYAILGSLKTNMELLLGESFFPEHWHFDNYVYAFKKLNFLRYTLNSVYLCLLCTILSIVVSSMTGYCMERHDFPGKKILDKVYLSLMFISLGSVTIYPVYRMMAKVNMVNLFGLSLIIVGGQMSNIFLVRGFVKSVPKELDESAMVDGATPFTIFRTIIFPLIRPIIAVVGLFAFRNAWNEYLTALVFAIGKKQMQTLTVAVVSLKYSTNAAAEWHIMLAGASIALIPMLIVYFFTNKQFIQGLTAGAVKG